MSGITTLALLIIALCPGAEAQQNLGYGKPSTATETSHIFKTAGGLLYDLQVNSTTSAGWVLLVDSATVPATGAVVPIKFYQIATQSTIGISWLPSALQFFSGITALCSTTGPFTFTATSTCTFSGETQ